ncbi:DUF4279 domain-containing protein [Hymenobacter sp. GOD-10R]|uniref:DUF4279 domain-containing protein n=1 Tax=Hymenobacter sp. GOD-10R TaxID=3093922 RepID=UPI002D76BE27|nr:DUF4279 domain-containing protein [Hymenobacter sp. GOD-10R]WRQ31684.1 DUF4279 domain-containing protein [Hymenobacter sp. GOD-10R]
MSKSSSYVYFAFRGDFNPIELTVRLGIEPTTTWKRGEGRYPSQRKSACWQLETARGKEPVLIDKLVAEVIAKLEDKAELILQLKQEFRLDSVLEIVLFVDMNEEASPPALGHDVRTINFLARTQTRTDVDLYRYDSRADE